MSNTIRFETAGRTDIGLRRKSNEDAFLVRPDLGLFVVADGIGGHASGEVAAVMAVTTLEELYDAPRPISPCAEGSSPTETLARLVAAVKTANRRIQEAAEKDRTKRGMGTTVVAALVREDTLCLAYVGDSRIYRLRDRQLKQLSEDHTVGAEWVKDGMSVELAAKLAMGRALSRALGTRPAVEVAARLETALPGDVLLLCSDGVHGVVPHDELKLILRRLGDISDGVDQLIARANDWGGPDNSTALLVRWRR